MKGRAEREERADMKVLLTSAGFENKRIEETFLALTGKKPEDIKAVFIPAAAIDADAIEVLPKCLHDLLDCGIPKDNIRVYDLHADMSREELMGYDAVYVCGGNTEYLLERINEKGFRNTLIFFIKQGGVYVGVSAGSLAAAGNLKGSLGILECPVRVHCEKGMKAGPADVENCGEIQIDNRQAILVSDRQNVRIIE